jgi:hypothetical protein
MVYFAYFHSIVSYGIIFWGSSASMQNVFLIQKRAVRIMPGIGHRSSCREAIKKLTLSLPKSTTVDLSIYVLICQHRL